VAIDGAIEKRRSVVGENVEAGTNATHPKKAVLAPSKAKNLAYWSANAPRSWPGGIATRQARGMAFTPPLSRPKKVAVQRRRSPSLVLEHDAALKRTRVEIVGWPVAILSLGALAGATWLMLKQWP
jgi:hypothetical protein